MTDNDRPIVLSIEQALAMPYATLRLVHLGWRVIRVEPTPVPGRASKGDPNRYIGRPVAGDDRHSYYVAPNVGKEAIALNLKDPAGQDILKRLIRELPVDVVCTNTMPSRHAALGIAYEALKLEREDLIWAAISAMGTAHPNVPGYDPAVQALCGYMDLTGDSEGPPMLCGPPIVDLKAGDEVFAQVMQAMWERERTGKGKMIDVSMAHGALSWLHTFLPMLDMGSPPDELRRNGNEHRQFIPVNAYPTADGFIYMALGSDAQWARFVGHEMFSALARDVLATNEGRRANKDDLHRDIAAITARQPSASVAEAFAAAGIPHAPITPVEGIASLPFVGDDLLRTITPAGEAVRLPPPAVTTPHLEAIGNELPFAPAYGEQTTAVLTEVGLTTAEVRAFRDSGVVA